MLVPPENNPQSPLSVTCSSWPANSYFQTPVCTSTCVSFEPKPQGSGDCCCFRGLPQPTCVSLPRRVSRAEKSWSGSEGIRAQQPTCQAPPHHPTTPRKRRPLFLTRLLNSNLAPCDQNGLYSLRRKHTFICTPVYIIFLFLHLNIKILLCFVL